MKYRSLLIFMCLGLSTFLAACKKESSNETNNETLTGNPLELLRNTWKVDQWVVDPKLNMPDSVVSNMIKNATMEFKADSTFIFKGMNPTPTTGIYGLSPDGLILTLFPTGATNGFGHSVTELTKKRLVLVDSNGSKLICSH